MVLKLPAASARPSTAYTRKVIDLATRPGEPTIQADAWRSGVVAVHRSSEPDSRLVVGAIILGGKAWRVVAGTGPQVAAWALRVGRALEDVTAEDLTILDRVGPLDDRASDARERMYTAFSNHYAHTI
jgi:hypothetical protein